MSKLRITAVLLLAVVVASGYAFAAPPTDPAGRAAAAADEPKTNDGEKKNGAEKKEEAKDKKGHSYRDKLEARGKKAPPAKPEKKPKYKKWKEVLEDATAQEGLFKVWTKREDVYFELGEQNLDKPYLALLSLSKGIGARFVLGGLPITDVMFDFHRVEDHVQIRMLNTLFRATDDPELMRAVELSYGNSILAQLPIESENEKDKTVLVNMNEFFLSDISDIGYFLQLVLNKPARLDAKKTLYRKVKAFPQNVEIDALLTYSPMDRTGLSVPSVPDNRFMEIGVQYSIHELPAEPMKPRLADDRVGYFLTAFKDFTRDEGEDFFVHYANRWRLEKKDPTADMSEPVKPIVFYVDNTVPKKYQRYVKEGIEMWQKAFEAAGFKNAIIAKDAPTFEQDPDYDPGDARYNTIRWIVSDEPSFGAIGPSRVDPRTGEILDADILVEQSMLVSFRQGYRRFAGPEASLTDVDPILSYLIDPSQDPEAARRADIEKKIGSRSELHFGTGFSNGLEFLHLALLADGVMEPGMDVPEEYIGEALRWVICHEVGHTLGLRHNFKSSAATPFDKLNDRYAISEIGMTGSIMDYAAPNVSRDRTRQGYYYSPTVGTWDKWAIEWGYSQIPGEKSPAKEAVELREIAGKAHLKENTYGAEEDTYPAGAMDPLCATFDLSDDPLAWAKERIGVCDDIVANGKLDERVVREGGNYVPLRYAVETLIIQEYIAMSRAVKYVGGQYTARPHRGSENGDLPMTPVPAAKQREALQFVVQNGLQANALALPPDLLNRLADNKVSDWQNPLYTYGRRFDFPLTEWVAAVHNALLRQLLDPMLLQRVVEAQYKTDDPYRLSELFSTLSDAIWLKSMTPNGRTAVMQRNLQRIYLDKLIWMTVKPSTPLPPEAVAMARLQLTRLQSKIDQASKQGGLSDEALAHLVESKARIDRALDAKLQSGY
jgi:hypothetical protein